MTLSEREQARAQWHTWSAREFPAAPDATVQAATDAAMAELDAQRGAAAAVDAARRTVASLGGDSSAVSARSPASAAYPFGGGKDHRLAFYRGEARTALLAAFCPTAYPVWWLWQFMHMARREAFPQARSPWAILVPVYNVVAWVKTFGSLREAEAATTGASTLKLGLVTVLFVGNFVVSLVALLMRLRPGPDFVVVVAQQLAIASYVYHVQRSANRYLAGRYPDLPPVRNGANFSAGEVAAMVLGSLLGILVMVGALTA